MGSRRLAAVPLALLLSLLGAAPALAQRGPPFGPPGPPPVRPPITDRGAPFLSGELAGSVASPAVRLRGARIAASLRSGALVPAGAPGWTPEARAGLLALLEAPERASAGRGRRALLEGLTPAGAPPPSSERATAMVDALRGLLADPGRLPGAVESYNAFVRTSPPGYLRDPPASFLAVHRVLSGLVEAAAPGAVR